MSEINTDLINKLGLSRQTQSDTRDQSKVGQEQFLQLMLTQLQNQDPFKPMESGDFLTQIAQFTMASGVSDLNKSFAQVSDSVRSTQVLQASGLVGHTVLVDPEQDETGKSIAAYTKGDGFVGGFDAPQATTQMTVDIYDAAGQHVRKLDLGAQPAGMGYFSWDGLDSKGNELPSGNYGITVSALTGGEPEALSPYIADTVVSVTLGQSGQDFTVNLASAGNSDMSRIRQIM